MTSPQKFIYTNGTATDLRVVVEPWAEEFLIKPGQRVEIAVDGGSVSESIELEQLPNGLILYGRSDCIITLSSNGEELAPSPQE